MDHHISEVEPVPEPLVDPEHGEANLELPIALRKLPRTCTKHPIEKFVSYAALTPSYHTFVTNLDSIKIPNNVHEALAVPEWKQAVMEEMQALEKNGTWEIVQMPSGIKPVSCKWVFTPKYNADSTLNKLKARLVARGFTQTHGIDYNETFAPVAKLNTIRVLFSVAANLD